MNLTGVVERISDEFVLLRTTEPLPGYMAFFALDKGEGSSGARIEGRFFSADAPDVVQRVQPEWQAWLEQVGSSAAHR
jgi:hypothetical protein